VDHLNCREKSVTREKRKPCGAALGDDADDTGDAADGSVRVGVLAAPPNEGDSVGRRARQGWQGSLKFHRKARVRSPKWGANSVRLGISVVAALKMPPPGVSLEDPEVNRESERWCQTLCQ
jgi:hypothetical protein